MAPWPQQLLDAVDICKPVWAHPQHAWGGGAVGALKPAGTSAALLAVKPSSSLVPKPSGFPAMQRLSGSLRANYSLRLHWKATPFAGASAGAAQDSDAQAGAEAAATPADPSGGCAPGSARTTPTRGWNRSLFFSQKRAGGGGYSWAGTPQAGHHLLLSPTSSPILPAGPSSMAGRTSWGGNSGPLLSQQALSTASSHGMLAAASGHKPDPQSGLAFGTSSSPVALEMAPDIDHNAAVGPACSSTSALQEGRRLHVKERTPGTSQEEAGAHGLPLAQAAALAGEVGEPWFQVSKGSPCAASGPLIRDTHHLLDISSGDLASAAVVAAPDAAFGDSDGAGADEGAQAGAYLDMQPCSEHAPCARQAAGLDSQELLAMASLEECEAPQGGSLANRAQDSAAPYTRASGAQSSVGLTLSGPVPGLSKAYESVDSQAAAEGAAGPLAINWRSWGWSVKEEMDKTVGISTQPSTHGVLLWRGLRVRMGESATTLPYERSFFLCPRSHSLARQLALYIS